MPVRLTTTLLLFMLVAVGAVAAPVTIELSESASVGGERITVGQIARIEPAERMKELATIEVGPPPLPGDSRRLTVGYLKMRLRHAGVACDQIAFTGAECVEVRRAPMPTGIAPEGKVEVEAADQTGACHPVQPPVLVPRGSHLRLTVVCGAVVIGAEATLLEDAPVGSSAKMRVEQTRETVVAQIVQPTDAVIRRE